MIFVNFKTYSLGTAEAAVRLAKTCQEIASVKSVPVVPIVQVVDLYRLHREVGENLWVQHVDGIGYGPHTGFVLPAAVKDAGAKGTLLNHSEHKLEPDALQAAVTHCKAVGLKIMICTGSASEIKLLINLAPDYIAYEPDELIGGQVSVSASKPETIQESARLLSDTGIPLIVGAGIHASSDISTSLNLGAKGVLVSSDILTAPDPQKQLEELTQGFIL